MLIFQFRETKRVPIVKSKHEKAIKRDRVRPTEPLSAKGNRGQMSAHVIDEI